MLRESILFFIVLTASVLIKMLEETGLPRGEQVRIGKAITESGSSRNNVFYTYIIGQIEVRHLETPRY